jgi:SanA protein
MNRIIRWGVYALAFAVFLIVAVNATIYVSSRSYIYESAADAPHAQAVLIPGAPIYASGVLTPIFTDRVERAWELYQAGKVSKILVSGDNGTANHNEVNPVRNYLVAKGIPEKDIFLDHAGFDTYSSMYRARDIFGVTSLLIVSQSFHLPRAVFIARELGIEAYGVNSDAGHILFQNYLREVFANEKAVFELLFEAKPKYLGEKIPIEGDGSAYP